MVIDKQVLRIFGEEIESGKSSLPEAWFKEVEELPSQEEKGFSSLFFAY